MNGCYCYLAHGVQHMCPEHLGFMPTRANSWVEAGLCRHCVCDELERAEAHLVMLKQRLLRSRLPQAWTVPAQENAPPA